MRREEADARVWGRRTPRSPGDSGPSQAAPRQPWRLGLLPQPQGPEACRAALTPPWVTARRPQGSGSRRGWGASLPASPTHKGVKVAEAKTEKLRRPHRRCDHSRVPNSPCPAWPQRLQPGETAPARPSGARQRWGLVRPPAAWPGKVPGGARGAGERGEG